jgi:peptidylprolyl isomerase
MRLHLILSGLSLLALVGCGSGPEKPKQTFLKELKKEDLKVGTGSAAEVGDQVWVRYTGKYLDGREFDSNAKDDKPLLSTRLGTNGVIKGWEEGILGMKEGGKRHLSVPFSMAYGPEGGNGIPPFTDLYFDIELVRLMKAKQTTEIKVKIDRPGTGRPCKNGDTVTIEYTGKTMEGQDIDSSKKQGGPVSFKMGGNELLAAGLEDAIRGMKVGEKRTIEIPPGLGMPVGTAGVMQPTIQVFEVTLKSIK